MVGVTPPPSLMFGLVITTLPPLPTHPHLTSPHSYIPHKFPLLPYLTHLLLILTFSLPHSSFIHLLLLPSLHLPHLISPLLIRLLLTWMACYITLLHQLNPSLLILYFAKLTSPDSFYS